MFLARLAPLGGVAFFVLWFTGAQILYFAAGGSVDERPLPTPRDFPGVVMANQSSVHLGATFLLLAAASLLWFCAALRERVSSVLSLIAVLAAAGVAILLVLQAGLVVASVSIAQQTPELAWLVYKLSGAVGFESLGSTLLGAVTVTGFIAAAPRTAVPGWFWWLTAVLGTVLTIGVILEGLGVVPDGRFSILFGLWAFIAGFALAASPALGRSTATN